MEQEVVQLLLESGDPSQQAATARDLGRKLAARGVGDWLLQFRRLVARRQKSAVSEYERGFLDALELVSTGFERQATESQVDESEVLRIKNRAHWLPILRLLLKGAQTPSALAEQLEIHKSQLTRVAQDLEAAGLLTQVTEGRERPCRVTPRARLLLERIPEEPPLAPEHSNLIPAVVQCFGVMAREGRVGRGRLLAELRSHVADRAQAVLTLLVSSVQRQSLGFLDDDDALVGTEEALHAHLAAHVALGCSGRKTSLISTLKALSDGHIVYLRATGRLLEWDVLAKAELPHLRVLREQDLALALFSPASSYQIVYESPALLAADLQAGRTELIQKAHRRYCMKLDDSPPPKDFQSLIVGHPELSP